MKSQAFETNDHDTPTGHTIRVEWFYDQDHGKPWEEADGHGPVRAVRDVREKRPGERVLWEEDRGHAGYLYDFAEAVRLARCDGWGSLPGELETVQVAPDRWRASVHRANLHAEGADVNAVVSALYAAHRATFPTAGAYAAAAAEHDFNFLRCWCNDDWYWCGYQVTIINPEGDETEGDSLWGIDSGSMGQFEAEAVADARKALARELAEAHDAACRDLVTV